tara:strand:+ start:86 stop:340 length:255 start_codon:yes stop_codon:yes gene_type:complete
LEKLLYVFLVSSNKPKKVHAINEISPITRDMMARMKFPKNRNAIAVVMKIKEKIKKIFGGIFFRNSIIPPLKTSTLKWKVRLYP